VYRAYSTDEQQSHRGAVRCLSAQVIAARALSYTELVLAICQPRKQLAQVPRRPLAELDQLEAARQPAAPQQAALG
jgi:hypothetical protein